MTPDRFFSMAHTSTQANLFSVAQTKHEQPMASALSSAIRAWSTSNGYVAFQHLHEALVAAQHDKTIRILSGARLGTCSLVRRFGLWHLLSRDGQSVSQFKLSHARPTYSSKGSAGGGSGHGEVSKQAAVVVPASTFDAVDGIPLSMSRLLRRAVELSGTVGHRGGGSGGSGLAPPQ